MELIPNKKRRIFSSKNFTKLKLKITQFNAAKVFFLKRQVIMKWKRGTVSDCYTETKVFTQMQETVLLYSLSKSFNT